MFPDGTENRADSARFAYLLLTHSRPEQVENLSARILELSPRADVVVHHDESSKEMPWGGNPKPPVHLVDRGRVLWGDWSMIDATLRLLRYGLDNLESDWFVLLSGQHRPATDLSRWERHVAHENFDAYLPAQRLTGRLEFGRSHAENNLYLTRSRHRWATIRRPRSALLHRGMSGFLKLSEWVQPLVAMEFVHRRDAWVIGTRRSVRPLHGLSFYRGSQWVAVNRRAAVAALEADPRWTTWFKRSWIPDETYLHTVLRASNLVVSNEPTTFVLETPAQPTSGWMQLSLDDLPAVWASGAPFARKVDLFERPDVARAIDGTVDGRRTGQGTSPQTD
jgi:Core-2/I-Branching enzyme